VEREPDLLVLGGGAAGIAAARTGVRLGARTVLVERSRIGGDCTFTGCVPSKAFIEAARRGASFSGAMAAARRAVEAVAATEDDGVLAAAGVEVIHGSARFCAPGLVAVDGTTWKGVASYYDVVVDGAVNRDAAWHYPQPSDRAAPLVGGRIAFWRGVRIEDDAAARGGLVRRLFARFG
jgi:pyruvate/2-oxoglutarate dehydrogenase complex dihydrolipoamide dehydrogenase (E3) component